MIHRYSLDLRELDVARATDGWFRRAEPVILMAAYVVAGGRSRSLGRRLYRFKTEGELPAILRIREAQPALAAEIAHEVPVPVVTLALALEEDGADDVQRLYGHLDAPGALSVWSETCQSPTPHGILDLPGHRPDWSYPTGCHLMLDGRDVAATCTSDKWVGAVAWVSEPRNVVAESRLHFQSEDERNDWTAVVSQEQAIS